MREKNLKLSEKGEGGFTEILKRASGYACARAVGCVNTFNFSRAHKSRSFLTEIDVVEYGILNQRNFFY